MWFGKGSGPMPGANIKSIVPPSLSLRAKRRGASHDEWVISDAVLDRCRDAVVALNADLQITHWNDAAEKVYALTSDTVVGRLFSDVVSSRSNSQDPAQRDELSPEGPRQGRVIHSTQAGRQIPVGVSLLTSPEEAEHRYVLIVHDESDFDRFGRRFEERLAFERFRADLSTRFCCVAEEEIDGEIEVWLGRLVDILKVGRSSFLEVTPSGGIVVTHSFGAGGIKPFPKGLVDLKMPWVVKQFKARRNVVLNRIPGDLPEHAIEERRIMTESGMSAGIGIPISISDSLVCVLTFAAFDGPRDWPEDLIAPLRLVAEVFANAIVRKQAKQRMDKKQQELAHLGRVAVMGELASAIAHEIDQPLTAVISNAQAIHYLLEGEQADLTEARGALDDVIDGAMRISELVRRERRLLRKAAVNIAPQDINEVVREIGLFIQAEARQDEAKVLLELTPDLPPVMADRIQLQQVILNLARNGLQAMIGQPRETRVLRIRSAATSDVVTLAVTDAGPPLDDEHFEKMFEPFFTTKPTGLGMGLSISKSIVENHRGRISATRHLEGGLTMQIELPQARREHANQ
jgi:PAS domain S-box-containing protein